MTRRLAPRLRALLLTSLLAVVLAPAPAWAQDLTPPQALEDGALEVQVSIFVVDVLRILDADQSVEADVLFRLEWRDERLAQAGGQPRTVDLGSLWHPLLQPLKPRSLSELMPRTALLQPDGQVSYTQRLYGRFGLSTNLRDFPFDRHELAFRLVLPRRTYIEMRAVPGSYSGRSDAFSIPDWTILGGELVLEALPLSEVLPPLQSVSFVMQAERNVSHYLTKIILPLIVIVIISWTVFWAPPPQIAVQFGFAATSILTVIAYRFALASQLPPVPYSTRLDEFLNGAFIMVALALVEVVVTAQLIYKDRVATALKVDGFCRVVFPIVLAAIAAWSFLL
jgi:hypothetical protein